MTATRSFVSRVVGCVEVDLHGHAARLVGSVLDCMLDCMTFHPCGSPIRVATSDQRSPGGHPTRTAGLGGGTRSARARLRGLIAGRSRPRWPHLATCRLDAGPPSPRHQPAVAPTPSRCGGRAQGGTASGDILRRRGGRHVAADDPDAAGSSAAISSGSCGGLASSSSGRRSRPNGRKVMSFRSKGRRRYG